VWRRRFLPLSRRDFNACLGAPATSAPIQQQAEADYFVVCDPTEKELALFPDNTLSIVLLLRPEFDDEPNILAVCKPAGSTSLPRAIQDKCFDLAIRRSQDIKSVLMTVD